MASTINRGNEVAETMEPPAASATGSSTTTTEDKSRSSSNALPPCTLRHDEMACLKTALAVIVAKRRWQLTSQQQQSEASTQSSKKAKPTTAQEALVNVMGRPVSAVAGGSGNNTRISTAERVSGPRRLISQPSGDHESLFLFSQQLPLASSSNWASHLQHILKLAWQGIQARNDSRWQGFCYHVACQLEQIMAQQQQNNGNGYENNSKMKQSKNSTAQVTPDPKAYEWIAKQMTSFVVSSLNGSSISTSTDDAMQNAWVTVWKSIVQAKPVTMSELFVPILLELILHPLQTQQKPSTAGTKTNVSTSTDKNNSKAGSAATATATTTTTTLRLDPAHLLFLLETALESAPMHVLQATHDALSPAIINNDNDNKPSSLLLPSVNSSWYSTQDLAFDYYYTTITTTTTKQATHNKSNSNNDAGHIFLLRHGLAAISEALTVAVASTNVGEQSQ